MGKNVRMLTEGAVMISLAYALSLVKLFQLPNGGSVTPGSMVPILLFAIRWSYKTGKLENSKIQNFFKSVGAALIVGITEGIIQFILGPKWSFHPVSILFDYVVAFGVLGFAGVFGKKNIGIVSGVVLAIFLRFASHVISGVVVFYEYAGAQNPWIYSILYNGSFMSFELVISVILTLILVQVPQIRNPRITSQ